MSKRAEDFAYSAYPLEIPDHFFREKELARQGCIRGYEQAEKDTMDWVKHYILTHDRIDIFEMEDAFNESRK